MQTFKSFQIGMSIDSEEMSKLIGTIQAFLKNQGMQLHLLQIMSRTIDGAQLLIVVVTVKHQWQV